MILQKKRQEILDNLPPKLRETLDWKKLDQEVSTTITQKQPRIYQIELTSKCNFKCTFCPRTQDLVKNRVRDLTIEMSFKQFKIVLDKMPWLKSLELFMFGEPFLQKDLPKCIAECTKGDISTVIASNLMLATPERVDEVFEAGLDYLVMDIDSLDEKKYLKYRVGGNFELLQERVKYILAHPKRPYCIVQTISLDKEKEYTEEEFLEWTGGLKPDIITYKFLDTFRGLILDKGEFKGICKDPFYGFSIHADGNIVPCDKDWSGINVMGNIFKDDVMEVWHSKKYKNFRKQMLSKNHKPPMCRKCVEGGLINFRSQLRVQVNMLRGKFIDNK